MRILLISPCREEGRRSGRIFLLPQLSLDILAALTPQEHSVRIVEEERERIPLEAEADLVGITCFTSNAPRAYRLAREFRRQGRTVVLGGIHPTLLPEEALQHADSVVIGEAEEAWTQLLADFAAGKLRQKYHFPGTSLDRFVPPRSGRIRRVSCFQLTPVMTTRGCPHDCEFCSIAGVYGRKMKHVPVENVVRTLREAGGRRFLFLDDNIVGDPDYARELFAAIRPLGITWVGQASISFAADAKMMEAAAASGCLALFFGLESVSPSSLGALSKNLKEVARIQQAIRRVSGFGIHFHPSLIFGFDTDGLDVFAETVEFVSGNAIGSYGFNILTPYPGTPLHQRLTAEGRIRSGDWRHYDGKNVVFTPARMSPLELHVGRMWAIRKLSTLGSIARRRRGLLRKTPLALAAYIGFNLGCRFEIARDIEELPQLAMELFPDEVGSDLSGARRKIRAVFAEYDAVFSRRRKLAAP